MGSQRAAQVAVGDEAQQAIGLIRLLHPRSTSQGSGEVVHHIGQGSIRQQRRALINRHHQLSDAEGELPPQGSCRVIHRKVCVRHPLPLHPHRSQGITNRHGHGRAGGRRQVEGAHLTIHGSIQHHLGPLGQAGLRPPCKGNAGTAAAMQMGQQRQQLTALATIREQQHHIVRPHDPEIPMQGIEGIEVEGHQANRGEGGSDLAGDDAAFAHTGHHQLGALLTAVLKQVQSGFRLIGLQLISRIQQRLGFLLQDRGQGVHRRPFNNGLKLKRPFH